MGDNHEPTKPVANAPPRQMSLFRRSATVAILAILGFGIGALLGWIGFVTLGNILAGAIGGALAGAISTLLLAILIVLGSAFGANTSGSDAVGLFVFVTVIGALLGMVAGVVEAIAPGTISPDWWFTIGGLLNEANGKGAAAAG